MNEKKPHQTGFRLTKTAKLQLQKMKTITGKSYNQIVNKSIGLAFERKKEELKALLEI